MTAPEMTNPFGDVDISEAIKTVSDGSEPTGDATPPADAETAPDSSPETAPAPEPSPIDLGDLGTYTAEQLSEYLTELADLREKTAAPEPQRQPSPRDAETEMAMRLYEMAKRDPEVQKALEPLLKPQESRPRDPETGQFLKTEPGQHDPRLSNDFIQRAQEAIEFVHGFREQQRIAHEESTRLSQVDQVWSGFKEKNKGVVSESFEKAVADRANAYTDRTGRFVTGDDLVLIAESMMESRRQVLDEIKKKPAGTTVVTGAGGNELPAPKTDFSLSDLGKALIEQGAIR